MRTILDISLAVFVCFVFYIFLFPALLSVELVFGAIAFALIVPIAMTLYVVSRNPWIVGAST